jgi:bifunctional non-homologous end joining protein LigD
VPELAGLADVLRGHQVVLDGELIAGEGRSCDFYRVALRLAASARPVAQPLRLAVFDLLWLDGDLCRRPCAERRQLLERLAPVSADLPGSWLETAVCDR